MKVVFVAAFVAAATPAVATTYTFNGVLGDSVSLDGPRAATLQSQWGMSPGASFSLVMSFASPEHTVNAEVSEWKLVINDKEVSLGQGSTRFGFVSAYGYFNFRQHLRHDPSEVEFGDFTFETTKRLYRVPLTSEVLMAADYWYTSYSSRYLTYAPSSSMVQTRSSASTGFRFTSVSLEGNPLFFSANIPEPSTWAMMIGGFGMAGAAARRRNRTQVTYA